MKIWLISRHQGAYDWLKKQAGYEWIALSEGALLKEQDQEKNVEFGGHFHSLAICEKEETPENEINIASIGDTDHVIGNLPLHLVEAVIECGAKFININVPNQTEQSRSKDLTSQEMEKKDAHLTRYHLFSLDAPPPEAEPEPAQKHEEDTAKNRKQIPKKKLKRQNKLVTYFEFWFLTIGTIWLGSLSADEFKLTWDTFSDTIIPRALSASEISWAHLEAAFQGTSLDYSAWVSTLLVSLFAYYLFRKRNSIFSIDGPFASAKPNTARPNLIMGVSTDDDAVDNLKDILAGDLEYFENLIDKGGSPNRKILKSWQVNLISLRFHLKQREIRDEPLKVCFITTKESKKDSDKLKEIMERYAKLTNFEIDINDSLDAVDSPDDFMGFKNRINEAIGSFNAPSRKMISLDITSMTKVYSVVAATISMDKDLEFVYIEKGKPKKFDTRLSFLGNQ